MDDITLLLLTRISKSTIGNEVSWYQLDRMLISKGLHKHHDTLIEKLDDLVKQGYIVKIQNSNTPTQYTITEKGSLFISKIE